MCVSYCFHIEEVFFFLTLFALISLSRFDPERVAGGANQWWDVLLPSLFHPIVNAHDLISNKGGLYIPRTLTHFFFYKQKFKKKMHRLKVGLIVVSYVYIYICNYSYFLQGKMTCYKKVSWGLGPRPFYTDFVNARVQALQALRKHALKIHQVEDKDLLYKPPPPLPSSAPSLKVVFIRRYKKTKEQNPRGGGITYNRVLGDPEQVLSAF
jgi:hypothetical protein